MGKGKKQNKKKQKQKTPDTKTSAQSSLLGGKIPVLKFFGRFLLGVILFYVFYYSSVYEDYFRDGILSLQASLGGGLINIFGYGTTVSNEVIAGDDFSMSIKNGCDGLEATAIFLSAVLAFPIAFRLKIPGILLGFIVLFAANLIRITGLYVVGVHWHSAFNFFHLHGGLILFMFFALIILLVWANWAFNQEKRYAQATA
ncbi:MAG: archaeosortase/exosortase family protein [Bacteroidota bacterium]